MLDLSFGHRRCTERLRDYINFTSTILVTVGIVFLLLFLFPLLLLLLSLISCTTLVLAVSEPFYASHYYCYSYYYCLSASQLAPKSSTGLVWGLGFRVEKDTATF